MSDWVDRDDLKLLLVSVVLLGGVVAAGAALGLAYTAFRVMGGL